MQLFKKRITSFSRMNQMLRIDVKTLFGNTEVFLFPSNVKMRFMENKINIDGIKFKTSRATFIKLSSEYGIKEIFN